ncbi:MAG: hypothetical protein H7122_15775 [Chitinophagaceae bacterium]|nr:hypothetical protein [Chitinophagaceae bacterium]
MFETKSDAIRLIVGENISRDMYGHWSRSGQQVLEDGRFFSYDFTLSLNKKIL